MANRHTKLSANQAGEVAVSSTVTDSPILPIEQIERLKELVPGRVEWVFDQTQVEAEHRRSENRRINTLVFVERLIALSFALAIALSGMFASVYLAMHDHDVASAVMGGATLASMVTAFLVKGNKR
jgi:hypothetical protein